MDKFKQLLASRKFWAMVVGLAVVIVKAYKPDFPVSEEQITGVVVVIVGYILGVAIEDSRQQKIG